MRGEYSLLRYQLKGYLFEIILLELLRRNGFSVIDPDKEPGDRVRENRETFIEFKGRGCWHQIDCPCDYGRFIPFSYPLRLLGEVKFYATPLDKKYIRAFIGVIKDIQENYFVPDGLNLNNAYPRRMEIGAYFAANGFQEEAEKLAYAHGIKTISYANNYLIDQIKKHILVLEENYLSVKCMQNGNWSDFQRRFARFLAPDYFDEDIIRPYRLYWSDGYQEVLRDLKEQMQAIQTSFIGTTITGVFIHFVGTEPFPANLFQGSDEGRCRVYYEYDNLGKRYFWLEVSEDPRHRRFYFTPPESLDYAALFGNEIVLGEKERLFRALNVNISLNGISRNLVLKIDRDWLDLMHDQNR